MEGVGKVHSFRVPSESPGDIGGLFSFYARQAENVEQSLMYGLPREIVTSWRREYPCEFEEHRLQDKTSIAG